MVGEIIGAGGWKGFVHPRIEPLIGADDGLSGEQTLESRIATQRIKPRVDTQLRN